MTNVSNLNIHLYRFTIVVLLVAIFFVQIDYFPFVKQSSARHQGESPENQSVISIVDAVANLYLLLPVFTEPQKRIDLTLEERKAVESEFISLLDKIPQDTIIDKIISLKLVTPQQLSSIDHKRDFINRLASVAMNGVITPEKLETSIHGEVIFRTDLAKFNTREFTSKPKTIYALFDTSGYQDKNIFIKWYEKKHGRMSLFKQFPINTEDTNYVWIQDDKALPTGHFQVEVYRISEAFELLSKGSYQIK